MIATSSTMEIECSDKWKRTRFNKVICSRKVTCKGLPGPKVRVYIFKLISENKNQYFLKKRNSCPSHPLYWPCIHKTPYQLLSILPTHFWRERNGKQYYINHYGNQNKVDMLNWTTLIDEYFTLRTPQSGLNISHSSIPIIIYYIHL